LLYESTKETTTKNLETDPPQSPGGSTPNPQKLS